MNRHVTFTTGLVLCALLGLADLAGAAGLGRDGAPPVAVVVIGAVLGLVTLVAVTPAWRRVRGGVITVVVSRAVAGLLAIPAFFVDAPGWARLLAAITLVLTVAGVGLLAGAGRGRVPAGMPR
ncbi:hypothetical protein [Amycolatopsis granulosa]|uniref:hypothetical protein n=1 Tax=Amycolatopsis granulosa TaxID=185684 RepID=UPI001423EDD6|nr:hypothetical protein [Amycolatopsis granulosa]NIH83289.1 FtsH-binding integral membrane protein [Amycolatopsis granulosa]